LHYYLSVIVEVRSSNNRSILELKAKINPLGNSLPLGVFYFMKDKNNKYNGKVIQTKYKGYHFRSRTEARWAVFFDKLGVKYEYEPEGFELPDGTWYLPDFYLPEFGGGGYFEVKPDVDNKQEWVDKLEQVAKLTGKNCFILNGAPDFKYYAGGLVDISETETCISWFACLFCMYKKCIDLVWVEDSEYINKSPFDDIFSAECFRKEDGLFTFGYTEAVNYSRAFRFDTDKKYLGD
jgi:hypothetical protein